MTNQEVEYLLFYLTSVIDKARAEDDEWAYKFACSIRKTSRRKGWKPTQKQAAKLIQLVADVAPDDLELIE